MERIKVLIDKLQQQVDKQADSAQMMMTVQMLQFELQQLQQQRSRTMGTSKVAVVLPSFVSPESNGSQPVQAKPVFEPAAVQKEMMSAPPPVKEQEHEPKLNYNPLTEIPTLSHQKAVKEINETIAESNLSVNDRLREQKKELGDRLMDTPVKDLRKAIGINDRFTFISELFRGDEAMYERSLKTINSFTIYPEAEYWITRELEIKLGWDTLSETVAHFYQLVKRRFS